MVFFLETTGQTESGGFLGCEVRREAREGNKTLESF